MLLTGAVGAKPHPGRQGGPALFRHPDRDDPRHADHGPEPQAASQPGGAVVWQYVQALEQQE